MFPTRRRIRAPFTRMRRWFGMCFRDRDEQTGFGGGFRARDRTCWHSRLSSSSQMNKNGWKPPFLLPLPVKICTVLSKFQSSNKLLFVIFFFFFGHMCVLYHCNVGQAYGFRQAWSNNEVQTDDDLPGQLPGEAPVSLPPAPRHFLRLNIWHIPVLETRTFGSRETVDLGTMFWELLSDGGVLPQTCLSALRSTGFVIWWWGQRLEVGGGTGLGLIFLVLIKRLLKRFPDKRASLMPSGKAGLAFHFMLRQCKTKSLPNDCLIKE